MLEINYNKDVYSLNGFLKEAVDSYQTIDYIFDTISEEEKNEFMRYLDAFLKAAETLDTTNAAAFSPTSGLDPSTSTQKEWKSYFEAKYDIEGFIKRINEKDSNQSGGKDR